MLINLVSPINEKGTENLIFAPVDDTKFIFQLKNVSEYTQGSFECRLKIVNMSSPQREELQASGSYGLTCVKNDYFTCNVVDEQDDFFQKWKYFIYGGAGGIVGVILVICCYCCCRKRSSKKNKRRKPERIEMEPSIQNVQTSTHVTYNINESNQNHNYVNVHNVDGARSNIPVLPGMDRIPGIPQMKRNYY